MKDAILKEVHDSVLTGNEERCKQLSPYIQGFRHNPAVGVDWYDPPCVVAKHEQGNSLKDLKRRPRAKTGKNLKPVIQSTCRPLIKPCKKANEEIQIDFGGPIYNEKDDQTRRIRRDAVDKNTSW